MNPSPSYKLAGWCEHVVQNVDRLISYLSDPPDLQRLANPLVEDAVERCLERISEAVSRLTRADVDLEAIEPEIEWDRVRQFGNRLRHEYDQVAPQIVASVLVNHLQPMRDAALRLERLFDPDQPNTRPMA